MNVAASLALRSAGGQFAAVVRERQGPTPSLYFRFTALGMPPYGALPQFAAKQ